MATQEELWTWIYEPLQELESQVRDAPGTAWEPLRAAFLERAGLREPSDHPLIEDLFRQLDEMSEDDRNRLLSDTALDAFVYELAGAHAEATPDAEPEPGEDSSRWLSYLGETGPLWDGTEESWPRFRDWLRYDANERGLGGWADAFLAEAEHADKLELFARHDVAIAKPAVADLLAQLDGEVVSPVLAELAHASPGLAGLDEVALRTIVAEVLAAEIGRLTTQGAEQQ